MQTIDAGKTSQRNTEGRNQEIIPRFAVPCFRDKSEGSSLGRIKPVLPEAGRDRAARSAGGRGAGPAALLECPGCEPRSTGKRGFAWRGTASVASIRIWLRDLPNDLRDTR